MRKKYNRDFWAVVAAAGACVVGGGALAKFVSVEAGALLIAFGGWLGGLLKEQLECARLRRHYTDPGEPKTPGNVAPPPTPETERKP